MATAHDLAAAYAAYLNAQAEVERIEAAGATSDPFYQQLCVERDQAYSYYMENGGGLESHHDAPASAPRAGSENPGGRPTLRLGMSSEAVLELQSLLGIAQTGSFDEGVELEVKDFQRDAELGDDGVVGRDTWNALLNPHTLNPANPEAPPSPSGEEHQVAPEDTNTLVLGSGVENITWNTQSVFCSDNVPYTITLSPIDQSLDLEIVIQRRRDAFRFKTQKLVADARTLSARFHAVDVLPVRDGGVVLSSTAVDASANGRRTETPLRVQHVVTLAKKPYAKDRAHFALEVSEHRLVISSAIHFVKGWGGSVVKLGAAVPAGTGGVITPFPWPDYRWMRNVTGLGGIAGKEYWDGTAWQPLPAGFPLRDNNNFSVGFYKNGAKFTCQYGGDWPATFPDWNLQEAVHQNKIKAWTDNINSTWTGKFDIKRKFCSSADSACCRYPVSASVAFVHEAAFKKGLLIIAEGNIRSNDSLFYLGEPRLAMAAHEFGHHMGNPDEYAGAALDTGLNSDGATAGIDPNSIMGEGLSTVKARHFRAVCTHLTQMAKAVHGLHFHYEAVKA